MFCDAIGRDEIGAVLFHRSITGHFAVIDN